jgi:hypothetical protein
LYVVEAMSSTLTRVEFLHDPMLMTLVFNPFFGRMIISAEIIHTDSSFHRYSFGHNSLVAHRQDSATNGRSLFFVMDGANVPIH